MHRVFEKQLALSTAADGTIDLVALKERVCSSYMEFELDRRRADRAHDLMAEELEYANRNLERSANALSVQNSRFEAALNNMSQGLCLFDARQRLVVCNERFTRMFGLPDPACLFEQSLADVIAQSPVVQSGKEFAGFDEYTKLAQRRQSGTLTTQFPDGRIVSIAHEPMPDGGFVQTFEDITARSAAEAKIVHLATHDVLTDLPNRWLLHQRLDRSLGGENSKASCVVLCIDLDRFKSVNDTLGHSAGDALLQSVADRIRRSLRNCDTIARLGGDEFAVVLPGVDYAEVAAEVAQRLVNELSRAFEVEGNTVIIGASIGIAMAPKDGSEPDRLIRNADIALNFAKRRGRNGFQFFAAEMNEWAQCRRALEIDLRRAIERNEFELYYQPMLSLDSGTVCGLEALIRWNSPERGRVSPADFIPLAEDLGLIVEIGEWVLREACRTATSWPPHVKLAVNVSAKQFTNRTLVLTVIDALRSTGLAAERLELEITESVLMENEAVGLALLHELRAIGVGIVMDDFGTGYSSLAYLSHFPFDGVKIDRSFIDGLGRRDDAMAIVRAVAGLCNSLGISSTAEGVETAEQLALVGLERCKQVQGFLFSQPRPAYEIADLLRRLDASPIGVVARIEAAERADP